MEILHVFLLGVVKYFVREFVQKLSTKKMDTALGWIQSFNIDSLNISSIQPKYLIQHILSLVGKDFKIILQLAPFVFYQFMSETQRNIWISLCHLAPFIFMTHIDNMDEYQIQLRKHIKKFLFLLIQHSAQWINKPKFHMLLHLPDSIICYGPASLFASEKFESYNSVLRMTSIHSNKQAPGRDLAITFDNYLSSRFLFSGGLIYDNTDDSFTQASSNIKRIFQKNPLIQQSMGYNPNVCNPIQPEDYPFVKSKKISAEEMIDVL